MKTQLRKWGNSLAIRVPKPVADAARWQDGQELEIAVPSPGTVELRSVARHPTLAELVRGIKPSNKHKETDWGPPRGKEAW